MSQEEILVVLEENKGIPLNAQAIAIIIELNVASVRHNLNSLLKRNEVKRIILTKEELEDVQFSGIHYVWELN